MPKKETVTTLHNDAIDMLLCAFTFASTAMDIETHLYCTRWGSNILKKGARD